MREEASATLQASASSEEERHRLAVAWEAREMERKEVQKREKEKEAALRALQEVLMAERAKSAAELRQLYALRETANVMEEVRVHTQCIMT